MQWHIHGHDWAIELLRTHVAGDNLRHAYLFSGPEGVGRRTLALRFAQALNCLTPPHPGDFCDSCRSCRQIWAKTYPDLSTLTPEEGHKDIRIDQVRALQHTLALSPYVGGYRVALLPDFQRATTQAANALLKTLEEPPDRVVLLLTANAIEHLLPTIVSRCEVIRLRPASVKSTLTFLKEKKGIEAEKAYLLAHLSSGRVGAAIRMADDPKALSERLESLQTFISLLGEHRYERFKEARALASPYDKAREKISQVLPNWLSFWRDVFVRASGADLSLVNIDLAMQIDYVASLVSPETARSLVIVHEKAIQQLDAYANPQLLVETLMLQWPSIAIPDEVEGR